MKLTQLQRHGGMSKGVRVLLLAGLLIAPTYSLADDESGPTGEKSKPLYLHWIKPWYAGDKTPPQHILTFKVTPSEDFAVIFSDPKLKGRQFKIHGRIDERAGKYVGKVDAMWLSGTRYIGEFKLDEPRDGAMLAFSGAYFHTHLALSHQRSAKSFLKHPPQDDDNAAVGLHPLKRVLHFSGDFSNQCPAKDDRDEDGQFQGPTGHARRARPTIKSHEPLDQFV